ncbi:universal stress protein [Chitinimonas sp.]|uniref:universal stress protein n=1 Tax=Chitinimonas sp. TaxID=1934313 RepID=UPI002F943077
MYARLLVPTDGSATARKGVQEACQLAKALGAEIQFIYVVDTRLVYADLNGAAFCSDVIQSLNEAGAAILEEAKSAAAAMGVTAWGKTVEAPASTVADIILSEAAAWPADLIVMGTHGRRGMAEVVMGSDAQSVVKQARTPVLLVRQPA